MPGKPDKTSHFSAYLGNLGGRKNYDTCTFHLPRHSSFTIMQDFAKWGNTGQKVAENRMNTTIWTTKAHGQNQDKGKCFGRNP